MKFTVGDRVKFLNDNGEGNIVAISDEGRIITVRTDDGFDIPVLSSEVIPVNKNLESKIKGEEESFSDDIKEIVQKAKDLNITDKSEKKEQIQEIISENISENARRDILLGFVPLDISNVKASDIKMYLINDSDWDIGFVIGYQIYSKYNFIRRSWLPPHSKILVKKWNQTDLSKVVSINIQVIFMCKGEYQPIPPINKFVNISNISFYKSSSFSDSKFFKTKAVVIPVNFSNEFEKELKITPEEIAAAMMEKKDIEKDRKKDLKQIKEVQREVDLHIENLIENCEGLTPSEIMQIQLNHFYKELDRAIRDGIEKIIFIHGVGNGLLKHEIRKELDKKYPDLSYQDASFKEYGYGATMVFLK